MLEWVVGNLVEQWRGIVQVVLVITLVIMFVIDVVWDDTPE